MVKELKLLLTNHALILKEERDSTLRKEYTCISKRRRRRRGRKRSQCMGGGKTEYTNTIIL